MDRAALLSLLADTLEAQAHALHASAAWLCALIASMAPAEALDLLAAVRKRGNLTASREVVRGAAPYLRRAPYAVVWSARSFSATSGLILAAR